VDQEDFFHFAADVKVKMPGVIPTTVPVARLSNTTPNMTQATTHPNVANFHIGSLWGHARQELPQLFSAFLEALAWRLCLGRALASLIRFVSSGIAKVRVSGLWALGKSLGDAAAPRLSFSCHQMVSKRVEGRDK
jgi:hypothetical protein